MAADKAELEPGFVFVVDPVEPDFQMVIDLAERYENRLYIVPVDEERADPRRQEKHQWGPKRYVEMVLLRNGLLRAVRDLKPEVFFSLDSDILLHPDSLVSALDKMAERDYDAIGLKCYLDAGLSCPNYAMLRRNKDSISRSNSDGVLTVDVLMAAKLMSCSAYEIDYTWNINGEDIGWSKNCKDAGLKLGWDGTLVNKHVMRPKDLERIDVRCGY